MKKKVCIDGKWIGEGCPCFIIAEAGSNHDGSLAKALKLIDAAAAAGADAVKFQLFRADKLYPPTAGKSDYLKQKKSIFQIIKSMELSPKWLRIMKARCRKKRITFLASVFDEESADGVNEYVSVFKVASYELTHTPLLEYVAGFHKPVLLSTGTCSEKDIRQALRVLRDCGNKDVILFQCTAKYPAPEASLNLKAIPAMAEEFGVPVGFSDHSADPFLAPLAAVALGAVALEKHFTLSRKGQGPDHKFSIEPDEFAEMVRRIRSVEAALGDGQKKMLAVEKELFGFARRSIFTSRPVGVGEIFSKENLVVLRNGKLKPGLPPSEFSHLLGKKCRSRLSAYEGVCKQHVGREKAVAPLRLRLATVSDSKILWKWRCDPVVIRNSLSREKIPWARHQKWFSRLLKDPVRMQWIVEDGKGKPLGQVRVDQEGEDEASLHVGIDAKHRGKGYGQSAIAAAVYRVIAKGKIKRIKALILRNNIASIKSFKGAGFRFKASVGEVETWVWQLEGGSHV